MDPFERQSLAAYPTDGFSRLPQYEAPRARDCLAYASALAGGATHKACGHVLYLAERLSLRRTGRPIVDAPLVALPSGGFAAHVLATMREAGLDPADQAKAGPATRPAGARHAEGYDHLSVRDLDLIEEAHAAMAADPRLILQLPETAGKPTYREIGIPELLAVLGNGPAEVAALLEGIEEERSIARALAGLRG